MILRFLRKPMVVMVVVRVVVMVAVVPVVARPRKPVSLGS